MLTGIGLVLMAPRATAQTTSVDEIADVEPTSWYYQALQSLVENYGVLTVYSDRTFRANRPGTRAEVAQLINASMDVVGQLCAENASSGVNDDIAVLWRLVDELANEVRIIREAQ
jgi:hypothetical protein